MTSTHVVDHIHDQPMSDVALRSVAIESLLAEKGLLTPDQVQQQVNRMDARTPADGARVVARPGPILISKPACSATPVAPSVRWESKSPQRRRT